MINRWKNALGAVILLFALLAASASAQNPASRQTKAGTGSTTTVTGSGTGGQLPKWAGFNGATFTIDDSIITQDKFNNIGIGTTTPTAKLTVAGMIQTTLGGLKFPDGTVQTTAAVAGLQSIFHNATLMGNGTQGSPLGVALPLTLKGATNNFLVQVVNNGGDGGNGVSATGADNDDPLQTGGTGVTGIGGNNTATSNFPFAGDGVVGQGGSSMIGTGGAGVRAFGGDALAGGDGIQALGGGPPSGNFGGGGNGVSAFGGPIPGRMVSAATAYLHRAALVITARCRVGPVNSSAMSKYRVISM